MKKLIIPILLLTLFGCGPSLKERQATFKECEKKHYQDVGPIYQNNPQKLVADLCSHHKKTEEECFLFLMNAGSTDNLQKIINQFAFEKAEEVCGKYPTK